MKILKRLRKSFQKGKKSLAVLIDPDKLSSNDFLLDMINISKEGGIDYFFVGGSMITNNLLSSTIKFLKENTGVPVIIFPGSNMHIDLQADGILFLSLISGRNPELLIGQHVMAAPLLKQSKLEVLPVGYMLIGNNTRTSVAYMSNTNPIPSEKYSIATSTAIAGEMLGHQIIYIDGGSGGELISPRMIGKIKSAINIPLIVGGGINTVQKAVSVMDSGADLIVIGNAIEKNPELLIGVSEKIKDYNEKSGIDIH